MKMEAKARQTDIKMTARKLRRVINEVRGKAVKDARVIWCWRRCIKDF